eukprot:6196514-Pleurochrysis_carterae.AAC.1
MCTAVPRLMTRLTASLQIKAGLSEAQFNGWKKEKRSQLKWKPRCARRGTRTRSCVRGGGGSSDGGLHGQRKSSSSTAAPVGGNPGNMKTSILLNLNICVAELKRPQEAAVDDEDRRRGSATSLNLDAY